MTRALVALALALAASLATAQSVEQYRTASVAYNCAGATCDVSLTLHRASRASCTVTNGSNAARNVTWSLLDPDGSTVVLASTAVSVTAATTQAFTVAAQATTGVSNFNVLPVTPTRDVKLTVAAGGTSGNATVRCWTR